MKSRQQYRVKLTQSYLSHWCNICKIVNFSVVWSWQWARFFNSFCSLMIIVVIFFDNNSDEILRNFSSIVRANSYRRLTVKSFFSCSTRYKKTSWIDWKELFNIEMFFFIDLIKFYIIVILTLIRWHAKIFAFAYFRVFFFMFILWLMKWKVVSSYAIDSELTWQNIKIWKIMFFSYIIWTFNK